MNASFLPAIARPPHDPLTMVLDGRLGWRGGDIPGITHDVEVTAGSPSLTLAPLPGSGRSLCETSGSFGGLVLPGNMARLPDGRLLLLDVAANRLLVFDACACRFVPYPCIAPGDPRIPAGATRIATVGDELLVCVPGTHRVIVLDAMTGSSRGVWQAPAAASLPGIAVAWTPVACVGLPHRMVAVSDPANGGVHLCTRGGRVLKFIAGLGAVDALAVDRASRLYVQRDGASSVLIIDLAGATIIGSASRPAEVEASFPRTGIRIFADGAVDLGSWCASGPAVFDLHGSALPSSHADSAPVYAASGVWLTAPLDSETADCWWDRIELKGSVPALCSIAVATRTSDSSLTDDELADDSLWRPAGIWKPAQPVECGCTDYMLHSPPGRYLWLRLTLAGPSNATPCIAGMSLYFPRISLRRYLPAIFGAEPVAAEFTDRWLAIFDRGLRQIEAEIDGQARLFDPLSAPAAPEVPARRDFLQFLASWVGVTLVTAWPLTRRRRFLKLAPRLYPWRGTIPGMRAALYLFLGLDRFVGCATRQSRCVPCVTLNDPRSNLARSWQPPRLLLEHYRLRRWLTLNHARLSDAAKLWGERIVNRSRLQGNTDLSGTGSSDGARLGVTQLKTTQDPARDPFWVYAHRMSVFVPAACLRNPALARALTQFIESEKPAHVQADLILVEPRFRVGVQSMLGFDAVIGVRPAPVVLGTAVTGRATVLGGEGLTNARPPRTVGRTRIGMNTLVR